MTLKCEEAYKKYNSTPWIPLETFPDEIRTDFNLIVTEDGQIKGYFMHDEIRVNVYCNPYPHAERRKEAFSAQFSVNGISVSRSIPFEGDYLLQLGMLHQHFIDEFNRKKTEYLSQIPWYENELISAISNVNSIGFLTHEEKQAREIELQKRLEEVRQQAKDAKIKRETEILEAREKDEMKKAHDKNIRELYIIAANNQFIPWVYYTILVSPKEVKVLVEDQHEDDDHECSLDFTLQFYSLTKPDESGYIQSIHGGTIAKTQILGEIVAITEHTVNAWNRHTANVMKRIQTPFHDLYIYWNPSEAFNPPVVSDAAK